jgi:hypothetical protein
MKKVVRLTESDLVRLIKRVIKEDENLGENLGIKIKVRSDSWKKDLYFDVLKREPSPMGCNFISKLRGRDESYSIIWDPSERLNVRINRIDDVGTNDSGTISKEAADKLESACGNKSYVSMDKGGSSNYA